MNHEATAKVMKKKASGKKGKAHSVEFKRLKNGMTSMTHYEDASEPGNPYGGSREEMVHPSMAHAKKHLAMTMGDTNDEEAAEDEKGEPS